MRCKNLDIKFYILVFTKFLWLKFVFYFKIYKVKINNLIENLGIKNLNSNKNLEIEVVLEIIY